jgi:hypothetical protein
MPLAPRTCCAQGSGVGNDLKHLIDPNCNGSTLQQVTSTRPLRQAASKPNVNRYMEILGWNIPNLHSQSEPPADQGTFHNFSLKHQKRHFTTSIPLFTCVDE